MAKLTGRLWDSTEYLKTDQDFLLYLEAELEEAGADFDPRMLVSALGTVARAKDMEQIATQSGLGSYRGANQIFEPVEQPEWADIMSLMRKLGFTLSVAPLSN